MSLAPFELDLFFDMAVNDWKKEQEEAQKQGEMNRAVSQFT